MKTFVLDHILDIISGFCLSSTPLAIWPGFDFEQDRSSKIETGQNLISCRKDDDCQN